MPNTPLKNRKLSPWITEAVKHWRWQEDRLHPLFPVTSPEYSGAWMDEVESRGTSLVRERLAEHRFIERLLRTERQRIIDKLAREANADAEARHVARQVIIDQLRKETP